MEELRQQAARIEAGIERLIAKEIQIDLKIDRHTKAMHADARSRQSLRNALYVLAGVVAILALIGGLTIQSNGDTARQAKNSADNAHTAAIAAREAIHGVNRAVTCLQRWANEFTVRAQRLSDLSAARDHADQRRQDFTSRENGLILRAIQHPPKTQRQNARFARRLGRDLTGYVRWNDRWERLNARYKKASAAHPVPDLGKLRCNVQLKSVIRTLPGSTRIKVVAIPGPTVTVSVPVRVPVPGPTVTVVHNHTVTTTVPPGKGRK